MIENCYVVWMVEGRKASEREWSLYHITLFKGPAVTWAKQNPNAAVEYRITKGWAS